MEKDYTRHDMYMDLLYGALSAIAFGFFVFDLILVGVVTGLSFLGSWVYFSQEKVRALIAFEKKEFKKVSLYFRRQYVFVKRIIVPISIGRARSILRLPRLVTRRLRMKEL